MTAKQNEEFDRFANLTKRLLGVPKTELDQKVGEYNKRKEARKKAAMRRKSSKTR